MLNLIRSKRALLSLIAMCSLVLLFWRPAHAENADALFLTALYDTLTQNKLLDRSYQIPLNKTFRVLLSVAGFPQPLNLNNTYSPDALNIYIVNVSAVDLDRASISNDKLRRTLIHMRNNVLALPPNVIVFDSRFLADLILNVWNEQMALNEGMEEARISKAFGEPEEKGMERLEVHAVVGEVYRFNNIRNSRNSENSKSKSMDLGKALGPALAILDQPEAFAFSVAPVFYHELGHLRDKNFGSFFEFIEESAQYLASFKVRRQEEAADAYAITQLERLFSRQLHSHENQPLPLSAYQGLAATIKMFRDTVLLDIFSGFRGLEAEDHFVNFIHWDCRKKPEAAGLSFDDPRKIAIAMFQYVPMLTSDEFQQLRGKIDRSVRSATHAHNFIRGDHMVAALDKLVKTENAGPDETFMNWYTLFLDSMMKNDPTRLYGFYEFGKMQGFGFGFDRFTRSLDMDFRPAVTCPPGMCMVGSFKGGQPGFVEVTGPLNNLSSIRLVYPLFGAAPQDVLSGKAAGEYKRRLSFLHKFILAALNVPGDSAAGNKVLSRFADPLSMAKKCGTISLGIDYGNRTLFMTTINPDFWVNIEVHSNNEVDK